MLHHSSLSVEYLVVDGASVDGTKKILEKNKIEGRITRFISEPDHGIYDAMNKGIVLAEGDVCVFVNADDIINADAVESCLAPILSGKADYAVSSVKVLTEAGDFIYIKKPDFSKTWIAAPYCHQGMYCRTELLRKEGGFCLDYKIAADCALMWNLYRKQYRFSIIDAISASFSVGGASSDSSAYEEHLRISLEFPNEILQKASGDSGYRDDVLHYLHSYMRVIVKEKGMDSPIITKVAGLHKDIVRTMSLFGRCFIRFHYLMHTAINKVASFFSVKRKGARKIRSLVYSYLSKHC